MKKLLSLLLTLTMVIGLIPVTGMSAIVFEGIDDTEGKIFFTPNAEWLNESTRFSVAVFNGAEWTYEEMTPVSEDLYMFMKHEDAQKYRFCIMRPTAISPDQYTTRTAEINCMEEFNLYILNDGALQNPRGRWDILEIGGEGGEEPPSEPIIPGPNDQVSWGYSRDEIRGYASLAEALEMTDDRLIYITLITNIFLNETIAISDGNYRIDLAGFFIETTASVPFTLENSSLIIGTSIEENSRIESQFSSEYLFNLTNSSININGGTYRTQGAGIIKQSGEASQSIINSGEFYAGHYSVITIIDGTVDIYGGSYYNECGYGHITFDGTDYNENININNLDTNGSTTLVINAPGKSYDVTTLGAPGKVIISEEQGGTTLTQIHPGVIYYVDVKLEISFSEGGSARLIKKGSAFTLPNYSGSYPDGKVFEGWQDGTLEIYPAGTVLTPTKDTIFKPVWSEGTNISVSFDSNGGSGSMDAVEITANAPYTLPQCTFGAPDGKVFYRWEVNGSELAAGSKVTLEEDTTIKAIWQDGISITYKANGGIGEDVVVYVTPGQKVELADNMFDAPSGMVFNGWMVNGRILSAGYGIKVDASMEATAQWIGGYYVTYTANGGIGSDIKERYEGETSVVLKDNPFDTPDGMQFKCWEIDGEEFAPGMEVLVDSETIISAKWIKIHTVTYLYKTIQSNDAEYVRQQSETAEDGLPYQIKHPDGLFTSAGHHNFLYWEDEFSTQYEFDSVITLDRSITLTLVYDVMYNIIFDPSNGEEPEINELAKGARFTIPEAPTASEGKLFICWEDIHGNEYHPGQEITVSGDLYFNAVWVEYAYLSEIGNSIKNGIEEGKAYTLPQNTIVDGELMQVYWKIIESPDFSKTDITDYVLKAQIHGYLKIEMSVESYEYIKYFDVEVYGVYDNGFCQACGSPEIPELENGYYQIKNAGNMFWFAKQVNEGGNREIKGVLTDDIDLEDRPWTPIGTTGEGSNNFRGVFDGQGHTITGLNVIGEKSGIGFFGEVRGGTIKNFTIYGKVTVPGNYAYVGGVVGSACGVNVENILERNGATIQNIISYVDVTTTAHGVGRIGGFMGYSNHETLVENCAWYGTLDLGQYRAEAGVGGFIGRVQENSDTTIRNCGAYGIVKTNYQKGTYNNNNDIFIGGFIGWSVQGSEARPTNTVIENCLFAGSVELGNDITDMIDYSAFGCLSQIKSITNCYYLGENSLQGVNNNSTYKPTKTELVLVDKSQLESGEIAFKLGSAWGQTVGVDAYPVFYNGNNYLVSNVVIDGNDVIVENLFEDAVLIVASYQKEKMIDSKTIPVSGSFKQSISETGLDAGDCDEIKAFLWKDLTSLTPICSGNFCEINS